ncbi:MAG: AraC family transcriptional regulator [Paenibacillus sp.]|nr:AraC family transcriptional regulator [Paenibacillus sp.]
MAKIVLALNHTHEEEWRVQRLQTKMWDLIILFDRFRRKGNAYNEKKDDSAVFPIGSIIRYVHLHYREPLLLSDLAKQFSISPSYLSEQFKRYLGLNFVPFLHEVRIRHACSLIVSTDMTMLDIALEVGYGSFRTFLRIFRELKKMTPTEYRNFRRG